MTTMKPEELLEALSADMVKQLIELRATLKTELEETILQTVQKTMEAAQAQAGSESKDGEDGSVHPPGLCKDQGCQVCREAVRAHSLAFLASIEERVPGTKEKLAQWELMHSPVEIVS